MVRGRDSGSAMAPGSPSHLSFVVAVLFASPYHLFASGACFCGFCSSWRVLVAVLRSNRCTLHRNLVRLSARVHIVSGTDRRTPACAC